MRPVRIRPVDPTGAPITATWDPDRLSVSGGAGRWQTHERPGQVDATTFDRLAPWRVEFTWRIDGMASGQSVEPKIARLEQIARPGGGSSRPAVVQVDADWQLADLDWIIDDLDWLDDPMPVRDRRSGERLRQWVEVTLVEHNPPATVDVDDLDPLDDDDDDGPDEDPPRPEKTVTVSSGDTLWGIAEQHLGDGSRFREIADLNDIDNPDLIFPGDEFRLPER